MNYKSYLIEIDPTSDQIVKINKTIGTCRFIYNFYIKHNIEVYEETKKFVGAFDFSKWLNNEFLPANPEYAWIKEVSAKATKKAMVDAEHAYKLFFKGKSKFPKFKKRTSNVKMQVPKNNATDCTIERHRVKIPSLGFVRLKEFGYIPNDAHVKSMTVSKDAGRFFISILCETESTIIHHETYSEGIGVDLGVKDLAITSNGRVFENTNKTTNVKETTKKLKREQRKLSRKLLKKGESNNNRKKQILKVQKLHRKLRNKRTEYVRFVVNSLVSISPKFITIENLNVSGMLKNQHLSKAIQNQMFYYFKVFLIQQCNKHGIEVREVGRFFPSSKTCCCCGFIKKDLKLSDRTFICDSCGLEIDRDLNASYNIRDCSSYKIITNTVG